MKTKSYPNLWIVTAILAGVALFVMALTSQPVRAAGPWYVAPAGSDANTCTAPSAACASINGALNKPDFVAGDTVMVATGVYTGTGTEVVLLNKNATLSGGWNAGFTAHSGMSTIDGQGARQGIVVDPGMTGPRITAVADRFAVQNATYGIYNHNGILTINNSTISGSTSLGIYNS